MATVLLFGRILFGGYFLMMGLMHFLKFGTMVRFTDSKNIPLPKISVLVTGLLLLLGGVGIILGIYVRLALLCLMVFLIPTTFLIHHFWKLEPENRRNEMQNFLKNMALLGAVLITYAMYTENWVYAFNLTI